MNYGYKTMLALTLAVSGWFAAKAQKAQQNDSVKIETVREKLSHKNLSSNDSTKQVDLKSDSIMDDSNFADMNRQERIDTICKSIANIEREAVRFIAHFESLRMNAYFDTVAKKWTIGFGNTSHPDGRPIRPGDKIKDEVELMKYFRSYFDKKVAPLIADYLPNWNKLSSTKKVVLLDLFWNTGAGVLRSKDKNSKNGPSKIATDLENYIIDKSDENLSAVLADMGKYIYSRGQVVGPLQKRRGFEKLVFSGDIALKSNGAFFEYENENFIDLDECAIGASYSPKIDITSAADVCDTIKKCKGRNFADTLSWQLNYSKKPNPSSGQLKPKTRKPGYKKPAQVRYARAHVGSSR